MKNPEKIKVLEGLLARVKKNATEPRVVARAEAPRHEVHEAPTVDRKATTPSSQLVDHDPPAAAPQKLELAKVELVKVAAPKAEAPKAPEPPKVEAPATPEPPKVEAPKAPEPPKVEAAKAPEPPKVEAPKVEAAKHDEPPVTRADPQSAMMARESEELEELGPGDEEPLSSKKQMFADEATRPGDSAKVAELEIVETAPPAIVTSDELEELDEEDVIDGSPAPAKVVAVEVPEPPPARPQMRSVPPPFPQQAASPSERPRSIPPPFPGVSKPPQSESLEADVPLRAKPTGPTVEQLGGTIDLEEGPPANLELAPVAGPKAEEEPAEDEAVLPRATSPGLFTGPRPSAPTEEPAPKAVAAPAPIVAKLDVPASPAPVAAPVALAPPAPVDVSIAPEATPRAVATAEVARFIAASKQPSASTFGDLLDATLRLGT